MYHLIKYHPPADVRTIKPVVREPKLPFHYFFARSSEFDVDLVVECPDVAQIQAHFPHYSSLSPIHPDLHKVLKERSQKILYRPTPNELVFLVPTEDARPVIVDRDTPQYRTLPVPEFMGVTQVCIAREALSVVMYYWPDSFCHTPQTQA